MNNELPELLDIATTLEPDMLSNIFNSLNSVIERQNFMINMFFVFMVIFCLIYIIKYFIGFFEPFTKI